MSAVLAALLISDDDPPSSPPAAVRASPDAWPRARREDEPWGEYRAYLARSTPTGLRRTVKGEPQPYDAWLGRGE